jgi:hypothetical protein
MSFHGYRWLFLWRIMISPGPWDRSMAREADVQKAIVDTLTAVGFESLQVGQVRRAVTCPHYGGKHVPTGWQGNTPGAPDLFVGLAQQGAFPVCTWVGFKLKKSTAATVRPEQLELYQRGRVAIVTNPHEAIDDMIAVLLSLDHEGAR